MSISWVTVKLEQYVFRAIINHSFFRGLYVIVWIYHNGINEILLLFGVCGYLNATVSQKDTVSFPQHSGTQDESNLYFFL